MLITRAQGCCVYAVYETKALGEENVCQSSGACVCVCVCARPHTDYRVLACLYPCQRACVSERHWIMSTGGQWVSG